MEEIFVKAKGFYENLNKVPEAQKYLKMFNRSFEFTVGDLSLFFAVKDAKIKMVKKPAQVDEISILKTDKKTMNNLLTGKVGFYEAGGGYDKQLLCAGGLNFYHDISWIGILTRIAQENRQ